MAVTVSRPSRTASSGPPPSLPRTLRRPLLLIAMAATAGVGLLAVRYAGASSAGTVDRWLQDRLVARPPSAARRLAVLVDFVGEPLGLALSLALLGGICLLLRRPRLAVLAAAGPLLSGAVTTALKIPVGRTISGEHLAYPSGHTAVATALGLVLALLMVSFWQARPWVAMTLVLAGAGAGGLVMAWAQVYLDAHYPTDTLGGFGTALVVVPAAAAVIDRVRTDRSA